jgi:hypothetical protein
VEQNLTKSTFKKWSKTFLNPLLKKVEHNLNKNKKYSKTLTPQFSKVLLHFF